MNRSIVICASLFLGLAVGSARAQDAVLAELYGEGVHAYFSRDLRTAHSFLTNAISQGSRDPRCYYFRGLTYASLGRPDEADADFKAGAQVEVGTADRIYPVADSLQRVQGRMRLQIERHRQIARLTSHTKASEIQKARYEQLKRSEQAVIRDPNRQPAAAVPAPTEMAPGSDPTDPFASDAAAAPERAPEKPAEPAVTPAAPGEPDPFGAPAETPAPASDATTNPFADDAAPAAPATPAPEGDDPFK